MPATTTARKMEPQEFLSPGREVDLIGFSAFISGYKARLRQDLTESTYWSEVLAGASSAPLPDSMLRSPGFDIEPEEFEHVQFRAFVEEDDDLDW